MRVLGLTGGIGSGKSVVRRLFEDLGIPGAVADMTARTIHQDPQHGAVQEFAAAFQYPIHALANMRRELKEHEKTALAFSGSAVLAVGQT